MQSLSKLQLAQGVLGEFNAIPQPPKPPQGKAAYPKAIGPQEALHRIMASKNHQHHLAEREVDERHQFMQEFGERWIEGKNFVLVDLPLDQLDRKEFDLDEEKVQSLVKKPPVDDGSFPIVGGFDRDAGAEHVILDGNHRAEAAIRRGDKTMRAYVREDLLGSGGEFAEACQKIATDYLKGLVPAARSHVSYLAASVGEDRAREVSALAKRIVEGRKRRKDKRVKLNDILAVHRQGMLGKRASIMENMVVDPEWAKRFSEAGRNNWKALFGDKTRAEVESEYAERGQKSMEVAHVGGHAMASAEHMASALGRVAAKFATKSSPMLPLDPEAQKAYGSVEGTSGGCAADGVQELAKLHAERAGRDTITLADWEAGSEDADAVGGLAAAAAKRADEDRPTVFLGGKVSGPDGNWRKRILDGIRDAGWDAIDPKKRSWKPEKDIYKEVEGMINADLVVFHEGGTFTNREKHLLDAVGKPYVEVETPDEVRELVGDPATAGGLALSAAGEKLAFNAFLPVDPVSKFTPSVFPEIGGHVITSLRAAAAGDTGALMLLRRIRENPADFHGIIALNAMLAGH